MQIKCRVWDKTQSKMIILDPTVAAISVKLSELVETASRIVMFNIGIKDIKDKDIFLGDYIKCYDLFADGPIRGKVILKEGALYFECSRGSISFSEITGFIEVIGNEYQNPELA